jgi:hypothetical protein
VGPGTAGDPSGGGRAALDRHRDFLKIDPECIVEQEGGAFERRKPLTAVLNKWRDRLIHRRAALERHPHRSEDARNRLVQWPIRFDSNNIRRKLGVSL